MIQNLWRWVDGYPYLVTTICVLLILLASWIAMIIARYYLLRTITAVAKRSRTFWDEIMIDQKVFNRPMLAIPALIINYGIQNVPNLPDQLVELVQRVSIAWLVFIVVHSFSALLNAINIIYNTYPAFKNRPIKGFLQVLQITGYIVGIVFIVAVLANQSPWYFVSGLGAMMAVILLVFRDTLLSLVAGIQLINNDLIRIGDWIEMPQFDANGDIIDIALHVVKIQNWDRTITVIPTHKFLDNSFKNWRGMSESGGRRIMRSINIDLNTIRFLTEEDINRLERLSLLKDYLHGKELEISLYNQKHNLDPEVDISARRLTNIGTFRAYVMNYLRQHPNIHQQMTFLVRYLEPVPTGLPIQIYVFANDTVWANYETIQADIFDHLLAVIPEFGLRVYQQASGADFTNLFSIKP